MKNIIFEGIGTALITPFINGKIDYIALQVLIEKQIKAGTKAIIVLGTTGEPATLKPYEKEKIIKFSKNIIGEKAKLIVGCGANCTQTACNNYKMAKSLGVDGALIVTPYYNKCTQNGLIQHYSKISSYCDLPIIVYNVPSRTGVNIEPQTMRELAKIDNIVGIKEASGNISQILDIFSLCKDDVAIYSGEDSLNHIFYLLGGFGSISVVSNIFPKLCNKIFRLAKNQEIIKLNNAQQELLELTKLLFCEVNPIPIKAGLNYLGLCKNELRLPLTTMTQANFERLKTQIDILVAKENDYL